MKVRIGYGLGVRTHLNDTSFFDVVDALEDLKFDSLWVSERIGAEAPDPVVAMSVAAARTKKLKFGMSVMVLPGRNPVLLAKQLATLDRMSNGRLLPAFGLGVADVAEQHELTERLKADMGSDSWLSKNIRPMTLVFILITYTTFAMMSAWDVEVNNNYVELLGQWGMLIMSFYFGGRTLEKIIDMQKGKK
jgi:hypothetical protein